MDESQDQELEKKREEALAAFDERYDDQRGKSGCLAIFGVPIFLVLLRSLDRSWIDILIYVGSISLAIFLFTFVTNVYGPILPGKRRWKKDFVYALCHDSFLALLMGSAYYFFGAAFVDFFAYLTNLPGHTTKILLTGTITFLCAVVFFFIRLKARIFYGITEVIVGLSVACYRVASTAENENFSLNIYFILLTAGVYLIVRGFDNVHQGVKKRRLL